MKITWTKKSHQILKQATNLENYNRWIFSLFKKYFGKNILEVGSGIGGMSILFSKRNITLSDIRSDYYYYLKNRFSHRVLKLDIEKETPKELVGYFDTIFSANVFEHIKSDVSAIKNCSRLLKKDGNLLLFVPASAEIGGSLDKSMGHYRRYTRDELAKKAINAGFKILKIKYVNIPGYFIWLLRGKIPSNPLIDSTMAKIFDNIVVPFLYLEKYLPIPIGQSLMLVAKKK